MFANSDNWQPITPDSSIFRFASVAPPTGLEISRGSGKIKVSSRDSRARSAPLQRELDQCMINLILAGCVVVLIIHNRLASIGINETHVGVAYCIVSGTNTKWKKFNRKFATCAIWVLSDIYAKYINVLYKGSRISIQKVNCAEN